MKRILYLVILLFSFSLVAARESTELKPIAADTISNFVQLQIVGRGTFSAADISPDGNTLAVGTTAGIWFYQLNNLAAAPVYQQYGTGFTSKVRFDITGSYLEVTNYYPDVGDVSSMGLLRLGEASNVIGSIDAVHLSDDRRYIVHQDGKMTNTVTNEDIDLDLPATNTFDPDPSTVVINPDQSLMVVKPKTTHSGSQVQELQLYDRRQNRYVARIRMGDDPLTGGFEKLTFSKNGAWLIGIVAQDMPPYRTSVYRWSVTDLVHGHIHQYSDGTLIWDRPSASVVDLREVNNQIVITSQSSTTYEQTIEGIDLLDGTVQEKLQKTIGVVNPLTGDLIAFNTIHGDAWTLTKVSTSKIMGTLDDFGGSVKSVVYDADETHMLSINQRIDSNAFEVFVHLRNTTTWKSNSSLYLDHQVETLIGFQPDGRPIVVSAMGGQEPSEKRVDIWDIESGQILYSFHVETSPYIALSGDSRLLFVSEGSNRWLYNIERPQNPVSIALPSNELTETRGFFDPEGRYLALIEFDNNGYLLRLWDIKQQAEVKQITNRLIVLNPFADNVQFVKHDEMMVLCEIQNPSAGQLDYQITFWSLKDLLSQRFPSPFMTVSSTLCRLDFGIRRDFVVPTYGDGIQNWSTILADVNARSEGDQWWRVAKFAPDGTVIFGIDYNGEMTAWNPSDMSKLAAFQVSQWQVDQIDFIQNGSIMVLPASDGTIRLWGVPT